MIGRGMVADPGLALAIARHDAAIAQGFVKAGVPGSSQETSEGHSGGGVDWLHIVELMRMFWQGIALRVAPRHRAGRLKQWLNYLRRVYPEAQEAFDQLRLLHDPDKIGQWLLAQPVTEDHILAKA